MWHYDWLSQSHVLKYAWKGRGQEWHDQSVYQDHIKEEKNPPKEFCSYKKENGKESPQRIL